LWRRHRYDGTQDGFLHIKFGVVPCACLAILTQLVTYRFDVVEICWSFSIYLEAIAIVPQLIVLQRFREVENLDGHYIFFLGAYRALYIVNWIYRSYYEPFYHHNYVVYVAGIIQTCLYGDFFYYYVQSKYYGHKITLPT